MVYYSDFITEESFQLELNGQPLWLKQINAR